MRRSGCAQAHTGQDEAAALFKRIAPLNAPARRAYWPGRAKRFVGCVGGFRARIGLCEQAHSALTGPALELNVFQCGAGQAMADKIFINYRREDSIGTAGRLHDRLADAFGAENIFMDVDDIPVGVDFVADLNSQVAACRVFLVVIGPNWLDAKDEGGARRLDNPDDFVTIEIAAALARDIRVIPVLVDNARMPKADKLPEPIRPLVRRNAIEVRNTQFHRDADTLVARMRETLVPGKREALGKKATQPRQRRAGAIAGVAAVVLLLIGWGSYAFIQPTLTTAEKTVQQGEAEVQAEQERQAKAEQERQAARTAAAAEEKRKADEAERQRLAAEQERQAREEQAEAKRREEAERQRLAALKAEEERRRAAAEASSRYSEAMKEGEAAGAAGDLNKAIGHFNEAIRLNPKSQVAFYDRCLTYLKSKYFDLAIADCTEAIQLTPNYPSAFNNRGLAYLEKGSQDEAIADFSEAIRTRATNRRRPRPSLVK